jgi:hypothetical protein
MADLRERPDRDVLMGARKLETPRPCSNGHTTPDPAGIARSGSGSETRSVNGHRFLPGSRRESHPPATRQKRWPPVGNFVAAVGEKPIAIDTALAS